MADKSTTLKVTIVGDSKSGEKAFSATATSAERAGRRMGSVGTIIKGALGAQIIEKIAGGVAQFATDSVDKFEQVGKSTAKMQRIMGGSVEDVSRLGFATAHSGLDTEAFSKSMGKLSQFVAKGGKAAQGLGVDFKDVHGKLRPLTAILPDLADKFKGMAAGPEKSALAIKLFGKAGLGMLPFLNKGKAGIKELAEQSDRLGTTMSGKDLDAIKQNIVAKREWSGAIEGLQIQLGRFLWPALTAVTLAMSKIIPIVSAVLIPIFHGLGAVMSSVVVPAIKWIIEGITKLVNIVIASGVIGVVFGKIADFAGRLVTGFKALWTSISTGTVTTGGMIGVFQRVGAWIGGTLIPFVQRMGAAFMTFARAAVPYVMQAFAMIGAAIEFVAHTVIPWIGQAFAKVMVFLQPVLSELPGLFKDMGTVIWGVLKMTWERVQFAFQAIKIVIMVVVGAILIFWKLFGSSILNYMKQTLITLWNVFKGAFQIILGVWKIFAGLFTGDWGKVWTGLKQVFSGIWQIIKAVLGQAFNIMALGLNAFRSVVTTVWNLLWRGVANAIRGPLNTIKGAAQATWDAMGSGIRWLWNNAIAPAVRGIIRGFGWVVDGMANMLGALSHVPGFGWARDAANAMHGAANKARDLANGIHDIPPNKSVSVVTSFTYPGYSAVMARSANGQAAIASIRGNAEGGRNISPGLSWVGEKGPELMYIPGGSDIYTARDSARMAASGGAVRPSAAPSGSGGASGGIQVYVTVQGNVTSERDLARAIAGPIRDELVKIGRRNGGTIFPA